jgi:hypothetical protein
MRQLSKALKKDNTKRTIKKNKEASPKQKRYQRKWNMEKKGYISLSNSGKGNIYSIDNEQRTYLTETTKDYYLYYGLQNFQNKRKEYEISYESLFKYRTPRAIKLKNRLLKIRNKDPNKLRLRLIYTRYADDFIIIGRPAQ